MKATGLDIDEIRRAQPVVAQAAIRTPLVRLNVWDAPAEIYLKLENLQPIGSFKIRGAANAMSGMSKAELAKGVLVASAGVLMALSGLQKRVLRRKETTPRCPTCGRTDRYNCACRR